MPKFPDIEAYLHALRPLIQGAPAPGRRAPLHLVRGEAGLTAHDPGGLEVLQTDQGAFAAALQQKNRTLKRALTDQRLMAAIGNSCSDEILHAACLSPLAKTQGFEPAELARLHEATVATIATWTERLCREAGLAVGVEGHCLSQRHDGPRPLSSALSTLRYCHPANPPAAACRGCWARTGPAPSKSLTDPAERTLLWIDEFCRISVASSVHEKGIGVRLTPGN